MANQEKMLKVTWSRSTIGYNKKQSLIIEALGFKKIRSDQNAP